MMLLRFAAVSVPLALGLAGLLAGCDGDGGKVTGVPAAKLDPIPATAVAAGDPNAPATTATAEEVSDPLAPDPMAAGVAPPPATGTATGQGGLINAAVFQATADKKAAANTIARAQVLLDRARFSPGVIDGQNGENLRQAIAAFETARNLPSDGKLDQAVWSALVQADQGPAIQDYTITAADVAGPFNGPTPKDYEAMSKLERLGYRDALEGLAEKFHMDEAFLKALNPTADFAAAGTVIAVARPREGKLAPVARIEVDKAEREVRAYGQDGALVAVFPATVGSASRPAPAGEWAINAVARNPTWNYDPKRLTFGDGKKGKFQIAAGPNNPVGSIWIDLTKDTYGIHGGPDPRLIGKSESHGCVRLTNWDAEDLGAAVKKGVKVVFTGAAKGEKVRAA